MKDEKGNHGPKGERKKGDRERGVGQGGSVGEWYMRMATE